MSQTAPQEFPVERIHAAHRQAMMITAAVASSLPVYVFVVEFLRRSQATATLDAGMDMLRILMFAVAGIIIFMATVTRAMLLRAAPPHPEARLARLRTTSILTVAFAEVPAIFGLVLFLTTGRRGDFYALLVVSLYMIVRHFPRRESWENYVRRGSDAR